MINRRCFIAECAYGLTALVAGQSEWEVGQGSITASNAAAERKDLTFDILRADVPNGNNRIYTRDVLEKIVQDHRELVQSRTMMGELGMPKELLIHFDSVSHVVKDLKIENDYLKAEIEVLDTPKGKILQFLLDKNEVVFRSRGLGQGRVREDGVFVVDKDTYKLVAIDAVPPEGGCKAMKLEVELKDIKEVKRIASDYFGVIVDDEKARNLIQDNKRLAGELVYGGLDTCGRDVLADCIVEDVMKYVPCKVKDEIHGKSWSWPCFGSSQEYKEAFDKAFKENASTRGYKLAKCWSEK